MRWLSLVWRRFLKLFGPEPFVIPLWTRVPLHLAAGLEDYSPGLDSLVFTKAEKRTNGDIEIEYFPVFAGECKYLDDCKIDLNDAIATIKRNKKKSWWIEELEIGGF